MTAVAACVVLVVVIPALRGRRHRAPFADPAKT